MEVINVHGRIKTVKTFVVYQITLFGIQTSAFCTQQ